LVIHVYYKLYAYDYRINFYNRNDLYKIYKGVRLMRAIKKIPYKFVHVIWIDIVSDSAWRSIEDVKESKLPRCLSTGFLVSEEEDVVRLVSDFNFNEDGSIDECGNSTIIPKCVVQEIKEVS
tara:strand:- start:1882 stop:2247 length:366 start_codon:yes stop_codon:yes gene_type:complete